MSIVMLELFYDSQESVGQWSHLFYMQTQVCFFPKKTLSSLVFLNLGLPNFICVITKLWK